ncbi:MAG: response regulator [Chloroflexi bacterium]|nr:MAG: response regulator [Chloroflexota bacterium]
MAQVGLLEDNVRIARLCATMLQYAGHQVTVYEHPRDCLNALVPSVAAHTSGLVSVSSLPLPVDVLILDLHLPDINGMDVLNCLLAHPRTQALPLIFFTAATRHEIAHALKLAPHATFVEKPFTFNELTVAITDVLASSAK